MGERAPRFHVRSKIWIEDEDGTVAFGLGRYRILEAVDRSGSLQAAAKAQKMSYRAVWCRLHASAASLGHELVERSGRGSKLTPYARTLMKQYNRFQTIVEAESNDLYDTLMQDHLS